MSSIYDTIVSNPWFPLEIGGMDGVHGRDFSAEKRTELVKTLAEAEEDAVETGQADQIIQDLVRNGVCDSNGEAFADFDLTKLPGRVSDRLMDVVLAEVYGLGKAGRYFRKLRGNLERQLDLWLYLRAGKSIGEIQSLPMSWRNDIQDLFNLNIIGFIADVEVAWNFVVANSKKGTKFEDAFPYHHQLLVKPKTMWERLEDLRKKYRDASKKA